MKRNIALFTLCLMLPIIAHAGSAPEPAQRHLNHWMPAFSGLTDSQQSKLQNIYQLMLTSQYNAAEQQLALLSNEASQVLPLWIALLTELQQFSKISQLVNNGQLDPKHNSAQLAKLFQQQQPQVRFNQAEGSIPLETHWLIALPRVKVILNGHPYYFVLDTGASQSLITDRVAKETGLSLATDSQIMIDTATDNKVKAGLTLLPSFQLGPVQADNQPALVVDRAELEQQLLGFHWYQIDGIIGWPLLKQLDLTFDFVTDMLEIRQSTTAKQQGNLVWLFDDPMVITNRDEQPRLWFLDTGAGSSVLTAEYLTPAQQQAMVWQGKEFGGLGGAGTTERTGQLEQIRIAFPSLSQHIAKMTVRADHQDCIHSRCDGRLGVDVAAHHRMHLNFQTATFDIYKADK